MRISPGRIIVWGRRRMIKEDATGEVFGLAWVSAVPDKGDAPSAGNAPRCCSPSTTMPGTRIWSLQRYELLLEAGLIPEALRNPSAAPVATAAITRARTFP